GGQWLCRAVHPYTQGKPAVGAELRHLRGTAPGVTGVPPNLQHQLANRAARLPHASPVSAEATSNCCNRCVGFNPVSQKPQAVQWVLRRIEPAAPRGEL